MAKKLEYDDFDVADENADELKYEKSNDVDEASSSHHRFTDLFEENRNNLYDFLIRMCAEQHSVLHIMQEVLETLIRDLPDTTTDREFIVILFKTSRSFSAHIWKTSTPSLIPPESVEKNSDEFKVQREILTLHRREKEIICLKWMLCFSWEEIGEILEYPFTEERITGAELLFEEFCSRTQCSQNELVESMPQFARYAAPETTRYITQAVSKAMSGIVKNREITSRKQVTSYILIGFFVATIYYLSAKYTQELSQMFDNIMRLWGH